MPYTLQTGETIAHAAHRLLGDARLTNEIHVINGVAYINGERLGPPTRWAAQDPKPPQQLKSK